MILLPTSRSISPIESTIPESVSDFPMSIIINALPEKASPQTKPDPKDELAYGAYMTNASGCVECHTDVSNGQIIKELSFSGGREFLFPNGGQEFYDRVECKILIRPYFMNALYFKGPANAGLFV